MMCFTVQRQIRPLLNAYNGCKCKHCQRVWVTLMICCFSNGKNARLIAHKNFLLLWTRVCQFHSNIVEMAEFNRLSHHVSIHIGYIHPFASVIFSCKGLVPI